MRSVLQYRSTTVKTSPSFVRVLLRDSRPSGRLFLWPHVMVRSALVGVVAAGACWRFVACLKAHPRATAITALVLAALAVGGWQSWRWWESHRPREFAYNAVRQVVVSVSQAPAVVAPGAPDKDLKPVAAAHRALPARRSPRWKKSARTRPMRSRSSRRCPANGPGRTVRRCEFQPDAHWPPDTKLTVRLKPAALAKDLHLDTGIHHHHHPAAGRGAAGLFLL